MRLRETIAERDIFMRVSLGESAREATIRVINELKDRLKQRVLESVIDRMRSEYVRIRTESWYDHAQRIHIVECEATFFPLYFRELRTVTFRGPQWATPINNPVAEPKKVVRAIEL